MNHEDPYGPRPLASWFRPAAIASVLFMAFGAATYINHVITDPATLPLDRKGAAMTRLAGAMLQHELTARVLLRSMQASLDRA